MEEENGFEDGHMFLILEEIERRRKNVEFGNRLQYVVILYRYLSTLQMSFGNYVNLYYQKYPNRDRKELDFKNDDWGRYIYRVFRSIFEVLSVSKEYSGVENRVIRGIPFEEIDGISLDAFGFDTVVPKDIEQDEPMNVVSLYEIDELRRKEYEMLSELASEDLDRMVLYTGIVDDLGGISTEPLFDIS